jgi:hypothetical protein
MKMSVMAVAARVPATIGPQLTAEDEDSSGTSAATVEEVYDIATIS